MPAWLRAVLAVSFCPVIVAAILVAPAAALAQVPHETVVRHVDRFTTEDGLAENNVRAVVQDRTGFLWVLSRSGVLQRYDGHSFVDFRLLDSTVFAGRSRDVDALLLDDDRMVWAAVAGLLFRIDSSHRASSRVMLDQSVSAWTTDGRGRLWFVDGGSLKWIDSRNPSPVATPSGNRDALFPTAIVSGSTGELWLATRTAAGASVRRLNIATARSDSFAVSSIGTPVGLKRDSAGRVWLSGTRGLAALEPGAAQFRVILQGKATTPLVPDEKDGWFVATDDAMARIGPDGSVTEWLTADVFGRSALPAAAFVDREAGVWIATTTAGLVRLHTTRSAFDNYSSRSKPPLALASDFVMAIREQRDGTLLIGTLRGGAYRASPGWQQLSRLPLPIAQGPAANAPNDVWDFEEDDDGALWVATGAGICKLAAKRCHALGDGAVDIEKDASGRFWLARYDRGVVSFDPRREVFGDSISPSALEPLIAALFVERDSGWMWVGTGNEIIRVRVTGGSVGAVERFPTPLGTGDLTYDFHRDRRGNLLAGTGGGLLRLHSESGRFEFAAPPELRSSTIFSIAEDSAGHLWLGSAHGLVYYVPEREYAHIYNRRDNFLSGELNRRAALVRRSGTMVFGGIEGLTEFDPNVVAGATGSAPVVFTRWSRLTPDGRVDESLVGTSRLTLRPADRAFTIQFAALSYAPNSGRRYRYRIDGLNEWVESADNVATYSAPPPGRYVVQVQASTSGGSEWSAPGASVELRVIPPFWKTAWFRFALVASTALLIWLAHRWRLRQAMITERLRLRISRDLHDEIGAGLSSIALLSDRGTSENGGNIADHQVLRRIGESARAMVADLRDIVWAIDPDADRVSDVMARMQDVAATLLRDVKITYDLPTAEANSHIDMAVRRDLVLLYKEMLHNVAKHARATEVHVALRVRRGSLELAVSDNGIGFSPNGSHGGTGLKSLRERADRMGGDLRIDSAPQRGTTTRFTRTT